MRTRQCTVQSNRALRGHFAGDCTRSTREMKSRFGLIAILCAGPPLVLVLYLALAGPIVVQILLAEGRASLRTGWDPNSGEPSPCDFGSEALRWLPDRIGDKWEWYRWHFQDHVSDTWLSESHVWAVTSGKRTLDEVRDDLGITIPKGEEKTESNH